MPAVLPNELKVANWESLKKTLPAPYNKDATVAPTLTALAGNNAAVNWTILEQCVENANAAQDSTDRDQIIKAARTQLVKLDPLSKAATTAKTAIGKLKANIKGNAAFAKMFEQSDSFEKFVVGFKKQTETQLSNVSTNASNRAGEMNLDRILATPALKEKFAEFLKSEHSYENLEFLEAVKAGPSKAVYDKYIKTEVVNLSSKTKGPLQAVFEPPVATPEMWKAAYNDIFKLLTMDTLMRFKKTL
jgi:hypothetical protein